VRFVTYRFLKIGLCLCRRIVYITLGNNKYVNGVTNIRQYCTVEIVVLNHSLLTKNSGVGVSRLCIWWRLSKGLICGGCMLC